MRVRPHHRLRAVATAGAAVVAATAAAAAAAARPPIAVPVDPFPVKRLVEPVETLPAVHITGGATYAPGDLGPIERVIDPDDPLIHTDDLPGKYRILEQLYPDPHVLGQVINPSSLCPEEQEIRYHYITHLAPKVAQARMLYKGGSHIPDHDGWTCHSLGTWIVGSSLADDTVALDAAGVPPSFKRKLDQHASAKEVVRAVHATTMEAQIVYEGVKRECAQQSYPDDTMWIFFRTNADGLHLKLPPTASRVESSWYVMSEARALAVVGGNNTCVMEADQAPLPTLLPTPSSAPPTLPARESPEPSPSGEQDTTPPGRKKKGAAAGAGVSVAGIAIGVAVGLSAGVLVAAAIPWALRARRDRRTDGTLGWTGEDVEGDGSGGRDDYDHDDDGRGDKDSGAERGGTCDGAGLRLGDVAVAGPAAGKRPAGGPPLPTAAARAEGDSHLAPLREDSAAAAAVGPGGAAATAVAPRSPPPVHVDSTGLTLRFGGLGNAPPPMPPELLGSWAGGGVTAPPPPQTADGERCGGAAAGAPGPVFAAAVLPLGGVVAQLMAPPSFSDDVNVDALFDT